MIKIRCTNPENPNARCFSLLTGEEYRIGRWQLKLEPDEKYIRLSFPEDLSVSRNHAKVEVEYPVSNMADNAILLTPNVVVTDLGSKYGTYANYGIGKETRLAVQERISFFEGDNIKFGLQWNEYKIEYTKLIVTTSSFLKSDTMIKLRKRITALGGHVVNEWERNVDYFVADTLSLTTKTAFAIIGAKFMVIPAFFDDWVVALKKESQGDAIPPRIPNPIDYVPSLPAETDGVQQGESFLSFETMEARKQLFQGKTFIFCTSKQMKKLSSVIESGGGTCKLILEIQNKDLLKNENILLMNPSAEDVNLASMEIKKALDSYTRRKRPIQESELGLAAVYMSCDKHCNPHYPIFDREEKEGSLLHTQSQNTEDTCRVVVSATQIFEVQESQHASWDTNRSRVQETCIDDVQEESGGKNVTFKRKLKDDDHIKDELTSKKMNCATSSPKSLIIESQKPLSSVFGFTNEGEDDYKIPGSDDDKNFITEIPMTRKIDTTTDDDEELMMTIIPQTLQYAWSKNPGGPTASMVGTSVPDPKTRPQITRVESSPSLERSSQESVLGLFMSTTPETSSESPKHFCQKTKWDSTPPVKLPQVLKDVGDISFNAQRFQETFVPMVNRVPKITPKLEVINGKIVKNFKVFKKVFPLSVQRRRKSKYKSYKPMTFEIVGINNVSNKYENVSKPPVQPQEYASNTSKIIEGDKSEIQMEDVLPGFNSSHLRENILEDPVTAQAAQRRQETTVTQHRNEILEDQVYRQTTTKETTCRQSITAKKSPPPKIIHSDDETDDDLFQFY